MIQVFSEKYFLTDCVGSTPANTGKILKKMLLREGVELDSDNALGIQRKTRRYIT